MWCLGRLLPSMIGHFIPEDNIHWQNYLSLLQIIDYLFAPLISSDCVDHPQLLICDHHGTFRQLYPNCNIKPKMHYMVHYPDWIRKLVNIRINNGC
jgi:hypothetical protein